MRNFDINKLLVNKKSSIKQAMQIIDRNRFGVAFIVDGNKKLFGLVTDGDIRGAILKGLNIERPVESIANKSPVVIKEGYAERELNKLKNEKEVIDKIPITGSLKIPVLDKLGVIRDVVFLYSNEKSVFRNKSRFIKEGIKKVLHRGRTYHDPITKITQSGLTHRTCLKLIRIKFLAQSLYVLK